MEPFHVILHCIADFYRFSYKDAPIFNFYVASPGQRSYDISYHMVRIRAAVGGQMPSCQYLCVSNMVPRQVTRLLIEPSSDNPVLNFIHCPYSMFSYHRRYKWIKQLAQWLHAFSPVFLSSLLLKGSFSFHLSPSACSKEVARLLTFSLYYYRLFTLQYKAQIVLVIWCYINEIASLKYLL